MLRRSGVAVGLIIDILDFNPSQMVQVGVGFNHEETKVLTEEWPNMPLVGFEAHPGIFEAVEDDYPGVINNYAIGSARGCATLYSKRRHKDGSSLYELEGENVTGQAVDVYPLDDFIPLFSEKDILLWLDCEGSELDVLRGAYETLKRVAVINVEMTGRPSTCDNTGWCKLKDVHEFMHHVGFKRQWTHTSRSTAGQYDAIYVRNDLFMPSICSCPCEIGDGE